MSNRKWDDISWMDHRRRKINRRANYIIHIDNNTMRYDFSRFSDHMEAIEAEYRDFGSESCQKAILCAYQEECGDAEHIWNRMVERGVISPEHKWNKNITIESITI